MTPVQADFQRLQASVQNCPRSTAFVARARQAVEWFGEGHVLAEQHIRPLGTLSATFQMDLRATHMLTTKAFLCRC